MIQITDKAKCCGCTACYNICPKQAIKMVEDEEGFLYPKVDSEFCVNCGACDKVCPERNLSDIGFSDRKIFAFQNNKHRQDSTSGAFFSSVAEYIINKGGSVFGVGFDEKCNIKHMEATVLEQLDNLRGSKYVQSDMGDVFSIIKERVKSGKIVMFVGTPCQVAGLCAYMDKVPQNLYLVELYCYGVPSPKIYKAWVNELNSYYHNNGGVDRIVFRDKSYGYSGTNLKVWLKSGRKVEQTYLIKSFLNTFFSQKNMRPSCYKCNFRTPKSNADFRIGDMWEIGKYKKEMDDEKGTTIVRVLSEKGEKLLQNITDGKFFDLSQFIDEFKVTSFCRNIPGNREVFFEDFNKIGYITTIEKYYPQTYKMRMIALIKPVIGKFGCSKVIFRKLKQRRMKKHQREIERGNVE